MGTYKVALVFLAVVLGAFLFYWFQWRPSEAIKTCHLIKIQEIEKRHRENLNFYFIPSVGNENLGQDIDAKKNKPMYVKDLNARLDEYWGNIAFEDCLHGKGFYEK
jgi:hypothetical protein